MKLIVVGRTSSEPDGKSGRHLRVRVRRRRHSELLMIESRPRPLRKGSVTLSSEWATELSAILIQARDSPRDGLVAESRERKSLALGSVRTRVRVIRRADRVELKVRFLALSPFGPQITWQAVEFDRSLVGQLTDLIAHASGT